MPGLEASAYFGIDTNALEIRAEIEAAMRGIAESVRQAGVDMSGTAIPFNFGDQIVREINGAAEQTRLAMAKLIKATDIGSMTDSGLSDRAVAAAVGSANHAYTKVEALLKQLSPDARLRIAEDGHLQGLLDTIARSIVEDANRAYQHFRSTLEAGLQRSLPESLPDHTADRIRAALANDQPKVLEAELQRMDKIFPWEKEEDPETKKMVETGERGLDPIAYRAAWAQSLVARTQAEGAMVTHAIREEQRQVAAALADLVAQGQTDPYMNALGILAHPRTGMPVKKVGDGYAEYTNFHELVRDMDAYEKLKAKHEESNRMLDDKSINPLKGRAGIWESNDGRLWTVATKGAIQYFDVLDGVIGKEIKLRQAMDAREKAAHDANAKGSASAAEGNRNGVPTNAGFIPGLVSGMFGKGFNGGGTLDMSTVLTNLGTTAGSAVRYSVAYGGFYQLTQAMQAGLAIFMDYQDSFTDYEVAVGDSGAVTQSFTNDLMELSRTVGENVGAAFDAAARGVRAFASDLSDAEQKIAGQAIASASQKIAVIANKRLTDATGDAIAIGTGFGLDAEQVELLVPDAIANAKRNLGGDATQIAQGLSNFAVTAQEAGFSLQEAANIISLVQAKTDQSGQAVSTRLSRIISIISGNTGKNLARNVNDALGREVVDVDATAKEQIEAMATAYVEAGQRGMTSLQGLIRNQLGGTSNLRELLPLLENQGRLRKALEDSLPGAGQDEYKRKTENLIGSLNKIRASLKNLIVLAANSDIFAPFGLAVKVIEPTLHMLENVLKVFEKLESFLGPAGAPVMIAAEAGLAMKGVGWLKKTALATNVAETDGMTGAVLRSMGVGASKSFMDKWALRANDFNSLVGQRRDNIMNGPGPLSDRLAAILALPALKDPGTIESTRLGRMINSHREGKLDAVQRANRTAAQIEQAEQASEQFAAGVRQFAKIVGVVAALVIASEIYNTDKKVDDWRLKLANRESKGGATSEALTNQADTLYSLGHSAAKDIPEWWDVLAVTMGAISFGSHDLQTSDDIKDRALTDAKAVESVAKRVKAEEQYIKTLFKVGIFGDAAARTGDSLAASLEQLDKKGYTAKGKLDELFTALMTPPTPQVASWKTPATFAADAATKTAKALQAQFRNAVDNPSFFDWVGMVARNGGKDGTKSRFHIKLGELQKDIEDGVRAVGEDLSPETFDKILKDALDKQDLGGLGLEQSSPIPFDELRRNVYEAVRKRIEILYDQVYELRPLTAEDIDALAAEQQNAMNEANPTKPRSQMRQARENLLQWKALRKAGGRKLDDIEETIANLEDEKGNPPRWSMGRPPELVSLSYKKSQRDKLVEQLKDFGLKIRDARHLAKELMIADLQDLREAAEGRKDDDDIAGIKAVRWQFTRRMFRGAGSNIKLLESIMESLDRETVMRMIDFRRTAVVTAELAVVAQEELITNAILALGGGEGVDNQRVKNMREALRALEEILGNKKKELRAALRALARVAFGSESVEEEVGGKDEHTAWQHESMWAQAAIDPDNSVAAAAADLEVARANEAAAKKTDDKISALAERVRAEDAYAKAQSAHAASLYEVEAAKNGGAIAEAQAKIDTATATMNATAEGTTAWNNALAAWFQGQEALQAAVLENKFVLDQLDGDFTDPLEQARDEARAAARKLAADRRAGRGEDVLNADELDWEKKKAARQAAAFNRRFNDARTLHDLGHKSDAQYMSYLEAEHARLEKIKNRTRQQQEQLWQVEAEMKSASESVEGMWNFGDINTRGIAYQMRRYRTEMQAERRAEAGAKQVKHLESMGQQIVLQGVVLQVSAADVAKAMLTGKSVRARTTQPRRR